MNAKSFVERGGIQYAITLLLLGGVAWQAACTACTTLMCSPAHNAGAG